MAWAPEGRKGQRQADPKGPNPSIIYVANLDSSFTNMKRNSYHTDNSTSESYWFHLFMFLSRFMGIFYSRRKRFWPPGLGLVAICVMSISREIPLRQMNLRWPPRSGQVAAAGALIHMKLGNVLEIQISSQSLWPWFWEWKCFFSGCRHNRRHVPSTGSCEKLDFWAVIDSASRVSGAQGRWLEAAPYMEQWGTLGRGKRHELEGWTHFRVNPLTSDKTSFGDWRSRFCGPVVTPR